MTAATRLLLAAALSGASCFSPEVMVSDEDGGGGSSEANGTGEEASEDDATTFRDPSDGEAPERGPRLQSSLPQAGDHDASLTPRFELRFDRAIDLEAADGHVIARSQDGTEVSVRPEACWSTEDRSCIGGWMPDEFLDDGNDAYLPSAAEFTIIATTGLRDDDGEATDADQTIAFRTFEYEHEYALNTGYISGLAFDVGSGSLLAIHERFAFESEIQRIAVTSEAAGTPTTVATLDALDVYDCMGIDIVDGALYVACGNQSQVLRFADLGAATLAAPEVITSDPAVLLKDAMSVVRAGETLLVSRYRNPTIIGQTAGAWTEFFDGSAVWLDPWAIRLASATLDGTDYVFVGHRDAVYKLSAADGTQVDRFDAEAAGVQIGYDLDLEVDSRGRLWLGTTSGLHVLDPTSGDYEILAQRIGFAATAFALREVGTTVHAYFTSRDGKDAPIGHIAIDF